MKKLFSLLVFSFFTNITGLSAQDVSNWYFRKYQVNDGLSENTVNCLLQDKKGFLWIGTKDGLNRFDGNNFKIFRHSHQAGSLENNFVRCIVEGNNNDFYIGSDDGLFVMDSENENFERIESRLKLDKKRITSVMSLLLDKKGLLWIATMREGVYALDTRTGELRQVKSSEYDLTRTVAWALFEDRSGAIWVGTRFGLFQYNTNNNCLEPEESIFDAGNNSNKEILSIFEDKKGNLWLGTWSDGILFYNKQRKGYSSFYDRKNKEAYISHIRAFLQYDDNRFLVGADDGLYLFNSENATCKRVDIPYNRNSLGDQNIYSLMRDREGGIWVGTYFGGLNYLNTSILNIENYLPDNKKYYLSGKAVSQFCEDDRGNLWIATEDGGLNYFDTKTKKFTQPVPTSYHNIHSLLLDGDKLWIGTFSRGLDVYHLRTGRLWNYRNLPGKNNSLDDDCVFSLAKTKTGDIYVGTAIGLNKYNELSNDFTRIAKDSITFVYDIKEDSYKNIWTASYGTGGVAKLNVSTGKWTFYNKTLAPDNPIVNSKLTGIYIDNQKRLWISSEGSGIFLYDYGKDDFINISEKDGLPNNVVYGILDDQFGHLWVSSNRGLTSFHPDNIEKQKRYIQEDGLQSNEFNYRSSLKARDGKIYFGGINGFNCFYSQDLNENTNTVIPPVEISNLQLLGESLEAMNKYIRNRIHSKETVRLPYKYSSFTLSYVCLSYIAPTKNQYAYRLEGIDLDWNYVGNNKNVTYVNLAPGKYTFRVKASNNHGVWNEAGTELKFEILPPFWLSFPAKMIYFLLIILSGYFIIAFFIQKSRKKQADQLESYKTEQETAAFKSKIDFFTTIAHEIRTPVSLIKAPLEEIIVSGDGNENTRQNLSIIEKNSERLNVLINQLLDFRKMDSSEYVLTREKVNLKKYITELFERFNKTAQSKKIDFELILPDEPEIMIISDSDALTKIIGNFLTNALKFTRDKIILKLQKNPGDSYTVSVQDNGKGIPDDLKTRIFDPFYQVQKVENNKGSGIGLFLAKHLSEMMGGEIKVMNSPQGGAVFMFSFKSLSENTFRPPTENEVLDENESFAEKSDEDTSILIIEDNLEMLHFIENALKTDYRTYTSSGAVEALKMIDKKMYDIIITDIMMPETDGLAFTRQLRENINFSHIPIILLSAKTDNNTKIEGLKSGANVFIEKPFSTSFLKAQIASLLSNRKAVLELFNRSPLSSYSILTTHKNDKEFIAKLNEEIDKHISDNGFSIESLTDKLSISRSNLQRKLKSICGNTPGEYLRVYRLKKAAKLLLENNLRINETAFNVGFTSASYFTKCFIKQFGVLPKDFVPQPGHTTRPEEEIILPAG